MRIWHIIFIGFAFLLGGTFAFRYHAQYPSKPPRNFEVPKKDRLPFACGTIDSSYGNNQLDSLAGAGKTLFRNYCATCHAKDMKSDLTGPALAGVTERWEQYPKEDLYRFIRSSQQLIKEEQHPRAMELWKKWKPTVMNNFSELTDEEIQALLAYIELNY